MSRNVQSCSLALTIDDPVPGLADNLKAPLLLGARDMNESLPLVIRLLPRKAKKSRKKKTPGRVLFCDPKIAKIYNCNPISILITLSSSSGRNQNMKSVTLPSSLQQQIILLSSIYNI